MSFLQLLFNLNLAILALDHLLTGGTALLFPKLAIRLYKPIFGADIPATKEYFAILKPWGILGIFAGFVGILPIYDPHRYKGILWALIVVLVMRMVVRFQNRAYAEENLKIHPKRNLFHISLIILCSALIGAQLVYLS